MGKGCEEGLFVAGVRGERGSQTKGSWVGAGLTVTRVTIKVLHQTWGYTWSALKNGKSVPDMMETSEPFKCEFADIEKARTREQHGQTDAALDTEMSQHGQANAADDDTAASGATHDEAVDKALKTTTVSVVESSHDSSVSKFVAQARRKVYSRVVLPPFGLSGL